MASKGGRHYVIIPTLVDIESSDLNPAATTSLYCPFKVLPDHVGLNGPDSSFFKEVVGVVPTKIYNYHTGDSIPLNESSLPNWVTKIRYNYLVDGHKVISLVYNQDAFTDNVLREIEFKILFADGEFHSVKQPIVHSVCLGSTEGTQIDYASLFNFTPEPGSLGWTGRTPIDRMGAIEITNSSLSTVHFNTYSYTDAKFQPSGSMIPSVLNRDFFHLAYTNYNISPFNLGTATELVLATGDSETGFEVSYLFPNSGIMWEFRQLSRGKYNYSEDLTGGTAGKTLVNPLGDLIFHKDYGLELVANGLAPHGFKHLQFLNSIFSGIDAAGAYTSPTLTSGTNVGFVNPTVSMVSSLSSYNYLLSQRGFAGAEGAQTADDPSSALFLKNTHAARKNNDTSRRIDGIIYSASNSSGGEFESGTINDGYDLSDNTFKNIALTLMSAAETQRQTQQTGLYGYMNWGLESTGTVRSSLKAESHLLFNFVSPQDVISNFILGRHTYYLSRPFNAPIVNDHQSVFQSSLVAAIFKKNAHPEHVPLAGLDTDVLTGTDGLIIGGGNDVKLLGIPFHYYVDSFQSVSHGQAYGTFSNANVPTTLGNVTNHSLIGGVQVQNFTNKVLHPEDSKVLTAGSATYEFADYNLITNSGKVLLTWPEVYFSASQYSNSINKFQNRATYKGNSSLDENSVHYSQGSEIEPLPLTSTTSTFLTGSATYTANANSAANLTANFADEFPRSFPHAVALIAQTGLSTLYDGDERKVYVRGCMNMPRGRSIVDSNYQLDLLLEPTLSNPGKGVTELSFTSKYNIQDIPSDGFTPYFTNAGTGMNCGCGEDVTNLQWKDASGNTGSTETDALDIFRLKYTPGRNTLDNSLFPVNESEYSSGSVVDTDVDGDNEGARLLTVNMHGENPTDADRPLVDVELNNFQWDEDTLYVSNLQIAGRAPSVVTQFGRSTADSSLDDINYSPQSFKFVSIGIQLLDDGGVAPEVYGCTASTAINYNSLATSDDGTCLHCDVVGNGAGKSGWNNIFNMLSNTTISPLSPINSNVQPFGLSNWWNDSAYMAGTWTAGQIGNAHNHWGPGLIAAGPSPAVPYGDNTTVNILAAPYTEFKLNFNFTPADTSSDPTFGTLVNALIDAGSFEATDWSITFFNIDEWTNTDGGFGIPYNTSIEDTGATPMPIVDYATNSGIGTMVNQGTVLNPVFASYTIGNLNMNASNFLSGAYVQSFLEPGKHYVVVLNLDITGAFDGYMDPVTGLAVSCPASISIPFNFWVTFCGCDILTASNYVGNLFDFPWSGETPFPSGYTLMDQCVHQAGSRLIKSTEEDPLGFCVPVPDPFSCDTFINGCIESTAASCIPSPTEENPGNQDFNGSVTVSIYGAYTNDEIDEYAFILNSQLFTFELYLVAGDQSAWDADSQNLLAEAIEDGYYYNFASLQDYLDQGFNPATENAFNILFPNLPQGAYLAVIVQTNVFTFQTESCPPFVLGLGTVALTGNGDCPDLIVGCMDPTAINYNPEAVVSSDTCDYLICDDVFLNGQINTITTTNTVIDCVSTVIAYTASGAEITSNTLSDQSSGDFTITSYDLDGLNDSVTGTYVVAYCQVFNGNSGAAVANILDLFASNNTNILDVSRTEIIPISANGATFGGFLGFASELPVLGTEAILTAGYYAVMILPGYVDVEGNDCVTEIINNFDSLSFFTIGSTLNYTNCPAPCNDQVNPEDCPDWAPGCTDENATNYDSTADYDNGTCNYGGQGICDQNPDAPGCEDCNTIDASGLPGFRDCDEVNDSTEGCCDPMACNFDPTVDVCLQSRCEYCCQGSEDCEDGPSTDECEDENGNILPDCVQPECPDPANPECDTPVIDPCPAHVNCPGPPDPECVILGTCGDAGSGGGDEDSVVVIDGEIIVDVVCKPTLNNLSFDQVRTMAMTCSANEGSKLLFKLRSGVKYDKTDLIKLTLINYLFNTAINASCMTTCENTDDAQAKKLGIERLGCKEKWLTLGGNIWTSTSTYGKGAVVGVLRLEAGKTHLEYYQSIAVVGAGDPHPKARLSKGASSKWAPCITYTGKNTDVPGGVPYVHKLYEFMAKFCEQCSIYSNTRPQPKGAAEIKKDTIGSGLVDENGNEIKLF